MANCASPEAQQTGDVLRGGEAPEDRQSCPKKRGGRLASDAPKLVAHAKRFPILYFAWTLLFFLASCRPEQRFCRSRLLKQQVKPGLSSWGGHADVQPVVVRTLAVL